MIAVRLLNRKQVHNELVKAGCTHHSDLGPQLEIWVTDFGFHFTVPYFSDDDWCAAYVLFEILADVERLRPRS